MVRKSIDNLALDLKKAILDDELELLFQSKVDIATDTVVGAEVFVHWTHPVHGVIPPSIWVKVATKFDFIREITLWALSSVLEILSHDKHGSMVYSINIPPSILESGFIKSVDIMMHKAGLPHKQIEFEITEQETITDFTTAASYIRHLQNLGILISLDDFGAGYSSMQYLVHLPVDTVKIDKSFVQDAPTNPAAKAVLSSLINLAKEVRATVLCEGVETTQQLRLVAELGANQVQGYYYGRPVPCISSWQEPQPAKLKVVGLGNS